ncbi:antibiotic biosynthesis monooxygenase [Mycobacteroides franklinii]|uniref:antibiotic biosynthesis monooxygenase n=1 Tax=Mycobacteroides franklinii TaxID=948102 RepID=UPI0013E8B025|nr:hypothetical protein [Mycobacteroides franklinii]
MAVTLVHVFEVPEGRESQFLEGFMALTAALESVPGYGGCRLMQRTSHHVGKFAFVNIASWESKEAWQKAIHAHEFLAQQTPMDDFPRFPGLYDVVFSEGDVSL